MSPADKEAADLQLQQLYGVKAILEKLAPHEDDPRNVDAMKLLAQVIDRVAKSLDRILHKCAP